MTVSPSASPPVQSNYAGVREVLRLYDVVIGIEVHCQLKTRFKIFSSSANGYGDAPNSNIDPTCTGLPGALPVLGQACVDLALRMGIATGCEIPETSRFVRKNYFYPDLPKGYQITQLEHPVCRNGLLILASGKSVRIARIQLEEDAGKNLHVGASSLCDFNRAGVGLIEIVSHPDLSSPEEAVEYVRRLHSLAVHLGVSDGDMERGNFRADANVSLKPKGSAELGQRTETKNVNSFRYLERAIAKEIERQFDLLESGGRVVMETRGYDPDADAGFSQRSKESAHDYRYFPEPDLPPISLSRERVERVRASLPELPEAKAARYVSILGLSPDDARTMAGHGVYANWFERVVERLEGLVPARTVSAFFQSDVLKALRHAAEALQVAPEDLVEVPVPVEAAVALLALLGKGTLSQRMVKEVFEEMIQTGKNPEAIVREKSFVQVSDEGAILVLARQVLDANPESVADYFSGKEKMLTFFVGQTMKLGQGMLNPGKVNALLVAELQRRRP